MEQIKILFFALASFFEIENGRIAADKTTVTVYPEKKEIHIIQENLFSMIQSENDGTLVLEQWRALLSFKESNTSWAKELAGFPAKKLSFTPEQDKIQPHLTISYSTEKDLEALGIWYNANKHQFSINEIPKQNIKTNDGKLSGNYWYFSAESTFSFTLEPFLEMPKNYQQFKKPLESILEK